MVNIDWDIIERKLEGTATDEELQIFDQWYAQNPQHQAYFEKVKHFGLQNGLTQEIPVEKTETAWQDFRQLQKKARQKKRRIQKRWISLTAGIAAVIITGLFLLKPSLPEQAPEKTDLILAGCYKAKLTLSNGKTIQLENNSAILQEQAVSIINSGAELQYKVSSRSTLTDTLFNLIETPKGGEYIIRLSDGTQIYLGPSSTLKFPVVFAGPQRVVQINGEAYLQVKHDQEHPFIVQLDNVKVTVLGTSFCVRNYADENHIYTTLIQGKVTFSATGQNFELNPGHQGIYERQTGRSASRKVDVSYFTDWLEGKINIRDERLEDILNKLDKWYNITPCFEDQEAKDLRFYANINRYNDLNTLLKKFEMTGKVKFQIINNKVYIHSVR